MKKFLLMMLVAALPLASFISCSDDDDPQPEPVNLGATVAGDYGSTYNITKDGKAVTSYGTVTATRKDNDKADLTIKGIVIGEAEPMNITLTNAALSGTVEDVKIAYEGDFNMPAPAAGEAAANKIKVTGNVKAGKLKINITVEGLGITGSADGDKGKEPPTPPGDTDFGELVKGDYGSKYTITVAENEIVAAGYVKVTRVDKEKANMSIQDLDLGLTPEPITLTVENVALSGTEANVAVSYDGKITVAALGGTEMDFKLTGTIKGNDMALTFEVPSVASGIIAGVKGQEPPVLEDDLATPVAGKYTADVTVETMMLPVELEDLEMTLEKVDNTSVKMTVAGFNSKGGGEGWDLVISKAVLNEKEGEAGTLEVNFTGSANVNGAEASRDVTLTGTIKDSKINLTIDGGIGLEVTLTATKGYTPPVEEDLATPLAGNYTVTSSLTIGESTEPIVMEDVTVTVEKMTNTTVKGTIKDLQFTVGEEEIGPFDMTVEGVALTKGADGKIEWTYTGTVNIPTGGVDGTDYPVTLNGTTTDSKDIEYTMEIGDNFHVTGSGAKNAQ